jgi:hypothetical protein
VLAGLRLEGDEHNILQGVQRNLKDDVQKESVAKAARELQKDRSRDMVKSTEWSESDELLMFRGKIYVPKDRELRHCIIKQHHDRRIAVHVGRFKTLELVSCNYWWPQMFRYISIYISTVICATGLKYNVNDLSVSSTLQRHLRHHGTQSASTS